MYNVDLRYPLQSHGDDKTCSNLPELNLYPTSTESGKKNPELYFEIKPAFLKACQLLFSEILYNSLYFLH